jgi:hypothetical protein
MSNYISITDDDIQARLAEAIVAREQEVFQYDLNIANYTAMLDLLPKGPWPSDLELYRIATPDNYPSESVQQISDLVWRDRLTFLLRTENIERNRANHVLTVLKAQIPNEKLTSLIATAKAASASSSTS